MWFEEHWVCLGKRKKKANDEGMVVHSNESREDICMHINSWISVFYPAIFLILNQLEGFCMPNFSSGKCSIC